VNQGLSRTYTNSQIGRIKRIFKWAVSEELVHPSIYQGLQTVVGLKFGRTDAKETDPVKPVSDEQVQKTLPYLSPQVAAMVNVQRLTAMRPGEVVIMRIKDIDMSKEVWLYEPHDHKNRWRGSKKLIAIGPRAQDVIRPFLEKNPTEYLFSPRDAAEWHRNNRPLKNDRKTPIYPSELRRRERVKRTRKCKKGLRIVGERYHTKSYRRAVAYGIKRAQIAGEHISSWHPHQLRHTRATEVRKSDGIEAVQIALGHSRADVTGIYADPRS